MAIAYNFLGDELLHKIQTLSSSLENAKILVSQLEIENQNLKDALMNLASQKNKKDSDSTQEALCA